MGSKLGANSHFSNVHKKSFLTLGVHAGVVEALPFDLGRHSFLEIILPVDPEALPIEAQGLADITVEIKLDVFPNEMVLRDTPLVEVTAAEVANVGMEARKFWMATGHSNVQLVV